MTSTPPPIDLHIPETFHRLKRTVMLLSAALIVLGFSRSVGDQTLSMTMVNIQLPIELIRWLLWGATIYYGFGLWMEMRAVQVLNSEALLGKGVQRLNQAMEKIARIVEDFDERLASAIEAAEADVGSLLKAARDPSKRLEAVWSSFLAEVSVSRAEGSRPNYLETQFQEAVRVTNDHLQHIDERLSDLRVHQRDGLERRGDLEGYISSTKTSFGVISRRIERHRLASFWVWEIGGAIGAFAIASFINAPHLWGSASSWIVAMLPSS